MANWCSNHVEYNIAGKAQISNKMCYFNQNMHFVDNFLI